MPASPFAPLRDGAYDLIYADPPWEFLTHSDAGQEKSPQAHYDCMPLTEIGDLDASRLASPNCWLLLWATAPALPEAMWLMRTWGFAYKTNIVWNKVFESGAPAMGTGYIERNEHELLLIGSVGKPWCVKPFRSSFTGVRREHSRKPDELLPHIDAFMPRARRVELFARQRRPGWHCWGKQVDRFAP